MKKRIGTKLYDTGKAICVLPDLNLYRQNTQTYFTFDDEKITPLDFDVAESILKDHGLLHLTRRKPSKKGEASLQISTVYADRLASYCRKHGITQKKVIENFIDTLEL